MRKYMKKWISLLGATASIVAPVAAIVSCDENKETPKPDETNNGTTPLTKQAPSVPALTTWDVAEDGIYFKKSTYKGKIFSTVAKAGQGVESTAADDELIPMPTDGSYMGMTNVVELGDKDTFYMVFDKDDTDGLTFDKFEDEFFFMDTSYSSGKDVDGFNSSLGSKVIKMSGWSQLLISFKDGHNQPWAGSQSNHSNKTFDEAMTDLKTQVSPAIYQDIETYYQSHSKVFVPLYQPAGLFTYKQVANNAYAITYNHQGTNLTAFSARVLPTNGGEKLKFDTFSVGTDKEWSAYHAHPEATYFAKKN